jgi:hypothetical protein
MPGSSVIAGNYRSLNNVPGLKRVYCNKGFFKLINNSES